ncbi:hypothetical protein SNEBB_000154 [Seison nebaliae]|nr:hypothetical protein SNEBB_000154 [Seison nebaliae]
MTNSTNIATAAAATNALGVGGKRLTKRSGIGRTNTVRVTTRNIRKEIKKSSSVRKTQTRRINGEKGKYTYPLANAKREKSLMDTIKNYVTKKKIEKSTEKLAERKNDDIKNDENQVKKTNNGILKETNEISLTKNRVNAVDNGTVKPVNDTILRYALCRRNVSCMKYVEDGYRAIVSDGKRSYIGTVQKSLTNDMRRILMGWIEEVLLEEKMPCEVIVLTITIVDRVLAKQPIANSQLQLLASAAIGIASKIKCVFPIPLERLVVYTDAAFTLKEMMKMENLILTVLQWDISGITIYDFIDPLIAAYEKEILSIIDEESNYLIELEEQLKCSEMSKENQSMASQQIRNCHLNILTFLKRQRESPRHETSFNSDLKLKIDAVIQLAMIQFITTHCKPSDLAVACFNLAVQQLWSQSLTLGNMCCDGKKKLVERMSKNLLAKTTEFASGNGEMLLALIQKLRSSFVAVRNEICQCDNNDMDEALNVSRTMISVIMKPPQLFHPRLMNCDYCFIGDASKNLPQMMRDCLAEQDNREQFHINPFSPDVKRFKRLHVNNQLEKTPKRRTGENINQSRCCDMIIHEDLILKSLIDSRAYYV